MDRKELTKLFESEIERAEIVLAIKDITDSLQKMASDISRKMYDDLPYITERIKASYGIKAGDIMEDLVKEKLTEVADYLIEAKSEIDNKALVLSGDSNATELEVGDMADDEGFDEPEKEVDLEDDGTEDEVSPELEMPSDDEMPLGRDVKETVLNELKGIVKENRGDMVTLSSKERIFVSPKTASNILEGYGKVSSKHRKTISESLKTKNGFKRVRSILSKK